LAATVGRLRRGDIAAANTTFNSYLVAAERITLVLLAAIGAMSGSWFRSSIIPGQLSTIVSSSPPSSEVSVFQLWSVCFDSAIWVSGRLDSQRHHDDGTRSADRHVVVLFTLSHPQLWHIALATIIAPMTSLILYFSPGEAHTGALHQPRPFDAPASTRSAEWEAGCW